MRLAEDADPVAEVADLGGPAWKTGRKRGARSLAEVSDLGYKTTAPNWLGVAVIATGAALVAYRG